MLYTATFPSGRTLTVRGRLVVLAVPDGLEIEGIKTAPAVIEPGRDGPVWLLDSRVVVRDEYDRVAYRPPAHWAARAAVAGRPGHRGPPAGAGGA
jgi:hypothetical protein